MRGVSRFKILAAAWCVVATGLIGCSTDRNEQTKTEQARLTLNPRVQRYMVEAEEAFDRGVYRLALAMTDSAEHYAPDLADVHFFRGRVYTELGQYDIARVAYQRAIELDPQYPGARMNMGVNEFRRGRLREALLLFHGEEMLAPNTELFTETARVYARLGVADSAGIYFEKAIALDSTNATAWMWYGQLFDETGDLERALGYSRTGLRLKPDNTDYQYIVGSQLYRLGQVEEAIPYLKAAADRRPSHHGAQYNTGQALLRLGRPDEADVYLARADSAQQLQQKISEAEDAVGRAPDVLENWITLGELNRAAGMTERAVDAFRVAVSMAPENLYLQTNLATLVMEHGDTEEAIRRFRAVLGIDSTLSDVWVNLGVAHVQAGDYDEARQSWEEALAQKPDNRTARVYLERLEEM